MHSSAFVRGKPPRLAFVTEQSSRNLVAVKLHSSVSRLSVLVWAGSLFRLRSAAGWLRAAGPGWPHPHICA